MFRKFTDAYLDAILRIPEFPPEWPKLASAVLSNWNCDGNQIHSWDVPVSCPDFLRSCWYSFWNVVLLYLAG